jgi:hypothetical protein
MYIQSEEFSLIGWVKNQINFAVVFLVVGVFFMGYLCDELVEICLKNVLHIVNARVKVIVKFMTVIFLLSRTSSAYNMPAIRLMTDLIIQLIMLNFC